MKKIAIVTRLSSVGGTEISLINFLNQFPEYSCDLTVIILGDSSILAERIPEWIRIKYVHWMNPKQCIRMCVKERALFRLIRVLHSVWMIKLNMLSGRKSRMNDYRYAFPFGERIDEQYDCAISWCLPNSHITMYTLLEVKAPKKIMWVHMDVSKDLQPKDAEKFFNQYDGFYCVSSSCKKSFDVIFPSCSDRTQVFYNVIPVTEIINKSLEVREELLLDRFVIMTAGRISYEKQPFFAIEIMKKLIDEGFCNIVWYFVGTGALYDTFQAKIRKSGLQDYIILLGSQMNPYAYISKADVYVQMSLHESFCLTLAEAQIIGIPAITTNFPSAYEIVEDDITGYIVENNEESLYKKIRYIIESPQTLGIMRNNLKTREFKPVGNISKLFDFVDS